MNVQNKFVSVLDEKNLNQLELLLKNSENARIRQRDHAIILSSKKFSKVYCKRFSPICRMRCRNKGI